jgi:hypothetical protein
MSSQFSMTHVHLILQSKEIIDAAPSQKTGESSQLIGEDGALGVLSNQIMKDEAMIYQEKVKRNATNSP